MPTYMFLSPGGTVTSPNGKVAGNLRLIGVSAGATPREALDFLMKESPWLVEQGWDETDILSSEIPAGLEWQLLTRGITRE